MLNPRIDMRRDTDGTTLGDCARSATTLMRSSYRTCRFSATLGQSQSTQVAVICSASS